MLKMQLPGRGDQGSTRVNDILHKFPFSLPYSGSVNRTDGKVYDQGTGGRFWSAGSVSAASARNLDVYGNYTYPEGSNYKTRGFSVRCAVFTGRKQSGNPRRAVWVIRAGSLEAEDKRSLFEDS